MLLEWIPQKKKGSDSVPETGSKKKSEPEPQRQEDRRKSLLDSLMNWQKRDSKVAPSGMKSGIDEEEFMRDLRRGSIKM